jgi:hypothetical protein
MTPFLVADRPISLSIIKGISLPPGARVGIMSQAATTTARFKELFRSYPFHVDEIHPNGQPPDRSIGRRTIKMVDSGIFGKNGCELSYGELFATYEVMRADYGIIIDVLYDPTATVRSARRAMSTYREGRWSFQLVGVAQGKTARQYLGCYQKLQDLGFSHIAIGGLLRRRSNTVRYVYVQGDGLLRSVLAAIRRRFDPDWLFALGAFHPKRIDLFQEYGVWGSDFKGWIFNYAKRHDVIRLIRSGKVVSHCRVAVPDLTVQEVAALSEQELRFMLTRGFVERRVLEKLYGSKPAQRK